MQQFKLDNGLKVLIQEQPENRVVTLDMWVNTGSAVEPPEINGVSHFLEHMMFKGTKTREPGEIDRAIEAVGGVWNAGTSIEFTHYYLTVGVPFVETGVDVLSDVIANSVIDPLEAERERQVILEEYHRQQDNPPSFLFTRAMKMSFEKSPNRLPVLGTPETIKAITPEDLKNYYISQYRPENMVLVVVGGVRADDILPLLKDTFGKMDRPYRPLLKADGETVRNKGVTQEFQKPVKETYLLMNFPAPDMENPKDVYTADIVSYIIGEGRSSRLYREVKEEKDMVSMITASYPTHKRDALFSVFATLEYEKKDDVIEAVYEIMRNLIEDKVSRDELDKAKRMLSSHYAFEHETTSGRASEIGFYYNLTGDTEFEKNYLKNINQVTREDIIDYMGRYMKPENANIFIVKPEES